MVNVGKYNIHGCYGYFIPEISFTTNPLLILSSPGGMEMPQCWALYGSRSVDLRCARVDQLP